jgi:hypothetical protein
MLRICNIAEKGFALTFLSLAATRKGDPGAPS